MAQKLKTTLLILGAAFLLGTLIPSSANAARDPSKTAADCASGQTKINPDAKDDPKAAARICVPVGNACASKTGKECLKQSALLKDLNNIVSFLSGLVGVVVVGVIILGGIQYAAAGDKAEAVSAAKKRITDGLIALVAFFFIFAFLQWLIPGGLFN